MLPRHGGAAPLLIAAYPDAKVLLTNRDPESWWESHVAMFQLGLAFNEQLTDEQRQWAAESGFARMQEALATMAPAMFGEHLFDKEHCPSVYEQHYDRVRRAVPAEQLLDYRVQEGWEPLCRFLGVDVPDEPFPRVNVGVSLRDNIATAMRLAEAQTGEPIWR